MTMRPYHCPLCREPMRHVETRTVYGTIGDQVCNSYNLHFECMTCPDVLGIIVSVPNMEVTERDDLRDLMNRKEQTVLEVDNRDDRTTWLWLAGNKYVEVDPTDLYENMLENQETIEEIDP